MEHISSRQNPLVKRIRDLTHGRGPAADVLLDGPHLVDEALRSGLDLAILVVVSDDAAGAFAAIVQAAREREVRIVTMPRALFESVAPTRHAAGILALAQLRSATLEDFVIDEPLVLILDAVQDPGNVGAIIRAAEACGATGVITGAGSADPWGWKALRGAMGSTFRLPVMTSESLRDTVEFLRKNGSNYRNALSNLKNDVKNDAPTKENFENSLKKYLQESK